MPIWRKRRRLSRRDGAVEPRTESHPRGLTRKTPPAIFRPLRRHRPFCADRANAPVAELVDALDSKSSSARSTGSIPARGHYSLASLRSFWLAKSTSTIRTEAVEAAARSFS